jgi:uncharacterized membrane protein YdbT with pleckstrin-like domain
MKNNNFIKTIKPSQLTNFGWFVLPLISLFYIPLIVPTILIALYKYFDVDTWSYNLFERTIEERRGVFNVSQEEVQYYRIKSIMVEEPLWMRLFGLCVIHIITSEQFKPRMTIYAVYDGEELKELISEFTYDWRLKMNIRDHDIYNI